VEPVDSGFEAKFAAGDLKLLDEGGCAGEEHAPAVLIESETDGGRQMALAAAGRTEEEQIGALLEPGVAGGNRHDLGPGDHRHGLELEGVEGLARQEAGFGETALDAAGGKSHLASAIGLALIENGWRVLFTRTTDL